MGWIAWIIVGLIAGFLAKLIMPGRDPGGFIGEELGLGAVSGINLTSILLATGGAVILLAIYRTVKR
jgi:uncharacterized membrane protein YeaQ/YmgE (transglycosylase-associated protein family)